MVKKSRKQARRTRLFYVAIGVVAIAGVAVVAYEATRPAAAASQYDPSLPAVKSNGYVLGSATAPLEVVEYADFECPSCGQFANIIEPDVRTNFVNTGKIRLRFIDFPLDMHRNTWNASRAAACADEQGKFWQMHDAIFQAQDRWNGEATSNPDKVLKAIAKQIGLNSAQFDQCVDSHRTQAKVQAHYTIARDMHVQATPTFNVNGKLYPGLQTYDQFKKIVDNALPPSAPKPAP